MNYKESGRKIPQLGHGLPMILWRRFLKELIAPLSDIATFYIQYLTMHKVHTHAGVIRQLLYGCAYEREIIHSLKLVDFLPVHTHKPYNNLHIYFIILDKLTCVFNHLSSFDGLPQHLHLLCNACVIQPLQK